GKHAENLFVFGRRSEDKVILICVPRFLSRLDVATSPDMWNAAAWEDTQLRLPDLFLGRRWVNLFTGETLGSSPTNHLSLLHAHVLLSISPVCLIPSLPAHR